MIFRIFNKSDIFTFDSEFSSHFVRLREEYEKTKEWK
jgi:hypothetical protein